ncbi:PAS domain-containing hybrid sensor histidine kinase/response regulator [Oleisolibacter albus]|uniref:hybrid sensor histidine kinase/response regulator n=1 Tax=Oleisolibacter albus TaxID=2171757 RepID=UPI000DF2F1ED|nr:PAS domain-containing hybrid sensor histidine kinase/response regulator [Oleisolibacter albus]
MDSGLVLALSVLYLAVLFTIAWHGDRQAGRGPQRRRAPLLYALSLAVYCTSWTFYGAIGRAATGGLDFLSIYVGPILMVGLGWPVLAKMVRVAKAENVVSISDFLSARYGKSRVLAALVTATAVVGVLPYFALQLKAITISLEALSIHPFGGSGQGILGRTTLLVTLAMAVFAVLFGVRNIHANEHHRGLMQAIATESLVKLAAALVVGAGIVLAASGGSLETMRLALGGADLGGLVSPRLGFGFWGLSALSALAIVCLPRQFHVMVVENTHVGDIRTAAWLFPAYLLAINLFVLPVALTGLTTFPDGSVNADTFLVTLPMHQGRPWLALLAFIGGLSAATSMVIVGAVALSTMVCNDLVLPLLMAWKPALRRWQADPRPMLLTVRRLAVGVILGLAYLYYLLIGSVFPLATIGTVSFAGVAQFAPALLVGLFNRRATKAGAIAGIAVGFLAWTYTVLLPSFDAAGLIAPTFGPSWLSPGGLGGVHDLDTLVGGALASLLLNLATLVGVSALTRQSELERQQARRFVSMRHDTGSGPAAPRGAALLDLYELAARYVGRQRADATFRELVALRNGPDAPFEEGLQDRIDPEAVRATEWLLSGAIGSGSARVVVASLLSDRRLSRSDARSIIDEASRAILDQHLLLRTTLEHVGKGICAWDRDFCALLWNRRFLEMLDVPEGLMQVGLPLSVLVEYLRNRGEYGRNGDMDSLLARRSDPRRQDQIDLYHRIRPDGSVLEISSNPLPDGGFVAVYTDVTERYRAAEALREANEGLERRIAERTEALAAAKADADRANHAKTRLLAAVSHDLLQPLHAARLFISAGMERSTDPLLPQADAALRSVEQLLGDLLDVTKLDNGVIKPSPAPVRVDDILRPLGDEFAVVAQRHGLALRRVAVGASVMTDAVLLRRILQNFLANAVRYTRRGRILLGCRRQGASLRIEVWDTGPGIPADKLTEIFKEFRQLDPGAPERDKGLGLGLSIVERLAGILGHRVTVRSWPGTGSCFAVEVPLAAAAPARLAPGGARTQGLEGTLVLCIENEETIARATRELLTGWSCDVVTGATADEVLAALDGRRPDVVLTDFHLDHGLSGLEVLAAVRAAFGSDIPAATLTADRSAEVRAAVEAAGCRLAYKPMRPGALRALLAHLAAEGKRGKAA